jgi:hypothetical protein
MRRAGNAQPRNQRRRTKQGIVVEVTKGLIYLPVEPVRARRRRQDRGARFSRWLSPTRRGTDRQP